MAEKFIIPINTSDCETKLKCFSFYSHQRWATDRRTSTISSTKQRVSCESCCKWLLLLCVLHTNWWYKSCNSVSTLSCSYMSGHWRLNAKWADVRGCWQVLAGTWVCNIYVSNWSERVELCFSLAVKTTVILPCFILTKCKHLINLDWSENWENCWWITFS